MLVSLGFVLKVINFIWKDQLPSVMVTCNNFFSSLFYCLVSGLMCLFEVKTGILSGYKIQSADELRQAEGR